MVPAGNKAKSLLLVNHTTKTIYHNRHHHVFNLCLYFDQSPCITSLLMGDLQNVLNSLKSSTIYSVSRYDDKENNEEQFQIGETVSSVKWTGPGHFLKVSR